jgi:glycosyltransferase involved in cell wall biosynthesis
MIKKDINIIIPVLGNSSWIGGLTYQENLIEALKMLPELNITLTNELDNVLSAQKDIPFSKRLFSRSMDRFNGALNKVSSWSKSYDADLQRKLDQCMNGKVNAIFTLNEAHLRGKNNVIKLYWIPDFQQLHLKHFFTKEDLEKRNSRYREGCQLADVIIVSSNNVKRDLEKFAPEHAEKCRVSSFVSKIPSFIWDAEPMVVVNKYSLPEKFFYLPNQFWKHKNHKVVFEALQLLREENIFPNIVCTGNPNDHRDPDFYKNLMKKTEELGIKKQIRFLGMVPYQDVMILIRQSIAVVNPSLFEGWSTTVEDQNPSASS